MCTHKTCNAKEKGTRWKRRSRRRNEQQQKKNSKEKSKKKIELYVEFGYLFASATNVNKTHLDW